MPMTPEAVAIYLGVILSGRVVVGISDASAPQEFEKRAGIGDARAVFTIDAYVRDGKQHRIYDKVREAGGPRAAGLPEPGRGSGRDSRRGDLAWGEFLGAHDRYEAISYRPGGA